MVLIPFPKCTPFKHIPIIYYTLPKNYMKISHLNIQIEFAEAIMGSSGLLDVLCWDDDDDIHSG